MTAVPWLPGVRWWKAGRGRRSLHVARAGHRVEAGQDGEVAGLGGLVEDGPDEVVEYLPPELEVVVAVFLTVSNPRTPGLVKADEPGFGSSCSCYCYQVSGQRWHNLPIKCTILTWFP